MRCLKKKKTFHRKNLNNVKTSKIKQATGRNRVRQCYFSKVSSPLFLFDQLNDWLKELMQSTLPVSMTAGLIDQSGWINISTSIDQADACFPALGKGVHVFLPTFPPGNVCMISRARYRSHVFPFSTLVHTSAPSSDWFIWLFAFAVIGQIALW